LTVNISNHNTTTIKMKKLFVSLALVSMTVGAFAQGSINFQNRTAIGKGKWIYGTLSSDTSNKSLQGDGADYSGRSKLVGTAYTAGLFVMKGGSWVQIATSTFRVKVGDEGLLDGLPVVKPDGIKVTEIVSLMIRVWDSRATGWDDVLKHDDYARGNSAEITNYTVGGDNNGVPVLQRSLIDSGLQSFALYTVVPEPSMIALGALGLGALLLRRRK
jgi:PEP-CTERM motif